LALADLEQFPWLNLKFFSPVGDERVGAHRSIVRNTPANLVYDATGPAGMKQKHELPLDNVRCPKCGSADVRRLRDNGILPTLFRILGQRPFRCRACRSRFYHSPRPTLKARSKGA
jgi:DNA-directed RNA polymerase subunit RPC12/RpoP